MWARVPSPLFSFSFHTAPAPNSYVSPDDQDKRCWQRDSNIISKCFNQRFFVVWVHVILSPSVAWAAPRLIEGTIEMFAPVIVDQAVSPPHARLWVDGDQARDELLKALTKILVDRVICPLTRLQSIFARIPSRNTAPGRGRGACAGHRSKTNQEQHQRRPPPHARHTTKPRSAHRHPLVVLINNTTTNCQQFFSSLLHPPLPTRTHTHTHPQARTAPPNNTCLAR